MPIIVDIDGMRRNLLNLVDEPRVCIREILQNSWEAIQIRKSKQEDLEPNLSLTLNQDNLIIEDNGVGMPPEKMKTVLNRLFLSDWEGQAEFKMGEFGMGLKTCLLVSNEISIISRSIDSQEAWCWTLNVNEERQATLNEVCNAVSANSFSIFPELKEAELSHPGTQVILKLDKVSIGDKIIDGKRLLGNVDSLTQAVKFFADFMPCPIILNGEKINWGGHIWESDEYLPEEWFEDQYGTNAFITYLLLPPENEYEIGALLFFIREDFKNIPKAGLHQEKKRGIGNLLEELIGVMNPKLSLYRQGLFIGEMDASDVLEPIGHRMVGIIECPQFELYLDRNRIRPGKRFKGIQKYLNDRLADAICALSKQEPRTFNDMLRSSEKGMKFGLCMRDDLRKEIGTLIRMKKTDGRWISLGEYLKQSSYLGNPNRHFLFYTNDSVREASVLSIYRDLNIPIIKTKDHLDVMLLKKFASDHDAEIRRIDESLELILSPDESKDALRLGQRLKNLLKEEEEVAVFRNSQFLAPVLLRISNTNRGLSGLLDTILLGRTNRSGGLRDILNSFGDESDSDSEIFDDSSMLSGLPSKAGLLGILNVLTNDSDDDSKPKRKSIFFFNLEHPVVQFLEQCNNPDRFKSVGRLLMLNAKLANGQQFSPADAEEHQIHLMSLLSDEIKKGEKYE